MAPIILNFGTGDQSASCSSRFDPRKSLCYADWRLDGSQCWSGRSGEDNHFFPLFEIEPRFLNLPAGSLFAMQTPSNIQHISQKYDVKLRTGPNWLGTGSSDGVLNIVITLKNWDYVHWLNDVQFLTEDPVEKVRVCMYHVTIYCVLQMDVIRKHCLHPKIFRAVTISFSVSLKNDARIIAMFFFQGLPPCVTSGHYT